MIKSNCSIYGCSNSRNKTRGLGITLFDNCKLSKKTGGWTTSYGNRQQKGLYIFVSYFTEKIKSMAVSFSSLILIITIVSNYKDFPLYGS